MYPPIPPRYIWPTLSAGSIGLLVVLFLSMRIVGFAGFAAASIDRSTVRLLKSGYRV
jgi:hypothetical protein